MARGLLSTIASMMAPRCVGISRGTCMTEGFALCDRQQCFWIPCRDKQQRPCRARRRAPSLLPVLKRSRRYTEQLRKACLREPCRFTDVRDVRHRGDPPVFAALQFFEPAQDLFADIAFGLSHQLSP